MSRQNKIAAKRRTARVHSDRRIAQRKALADKKRREEEALFANAAAHSDRLVKELL